MVVATASAGYFAYALMWAALLGAARALAADLSHQLAGRAHLSRPARRLRPRRRCSLQWEALALRHRAELHQARPRASEGRRAVPGAEPAHHQRPHRRADLRVLRRALRRGDRRRGHLQESAAVRPGTAWSNTLTTHLGRGQRTSKGSSPPSRPAARFSPSIFRLASIDQNELPNHLIVLDGRWSA